jgi:enoyl-CoA hydratase
VTHWSCFDVELRERVAHVALARPDELNTFTRSFLRELREIAAELSGSGSVRVVVLSSTGRHFSAGLDLRAHSELGLGRTDVEPARLRAGFRSTVLEFQDSITALERMRIPVLSAIQGGCVGGGLDLVTATDARYATADAFFSVEAINRASPADLGTLQRLPRLIPDGVARELAFSGRRMPAEEALSVGLINKVYKDQDAMLRGVGEIAERIAGQSPIALWGTKELLNYSRDHTVVDGLERTALWQAGMLHESDTKEAWRSFKDKSPSKFDDLLAE